MKLFAWIFILPVAVIASEIIDEEGCKKIFETLLSPQLNYKLASPALKKEVKMVLLLYQLQILNPNGHSEFSRDLFFKMISSKDGKLNLVHDASDSSLIADENEMNLKNKALDTKFINSLSIPRFPEISIELFNLFQNDQKIQEILIKNAITAPTLSKSFLKFLTFDFFQTNRSFLIWNIYSQYNLSSDFLKDYQNLCDNVFKYVAIERTLLATFSVLIPYIFQFFPINVHLLLPAMLFLFLVSKKLFQILNLFQFDNFSDISSFQYYRYTCRSWNMLVFNIYEVLSMLLNIFAEIMYSITGSKELFKFITN